MSFISFLSVNNIFFTNNASYEEIHFNVKKFIDKNFMKIVQKEFQKKMCAHHLIEKNNFYWFPR